MDNLSRYDINHPITTPIKLITLDGVLNSSIDQSHASIPLGHSNFFHVTPKENELIDLKRFDAFKNQKKEPAKWLVEDPLQLPNGRKDRQERPGNAGGDVNLSDISDDFRMLNNLAEVGRASWTSKMLDGTKVKLLEDESAVNNDFSEDQEYGAVFLNPFAEKIKQNKPPSNEGRENYIPGNEDAPPNSTSF